MYAIHKAGPDDYLDFRFTRIGGSSRLLEMATALNVYPMHDQRNSEEGPATMVVVCCPPARCGLVR